MISSKPLISLSFLLKPKNDLLVETMFTNGNFFALGRDALLSAVIKIGLKPGDCIIVPAYICYSTIKPLEDNGFVVEYVDINEKMELVTEPLVKSIKKNKAKLILVVHYFGFLVDLTEVLAISKKYGLFVIEDCAHSFLSGKKYQNQKILGDAAIFSVRKTLPVNGGGVLCIKNNTVLKTSSIPKLESFSIGDYGFILKLLTLKLIVKSGFPNIYSNSFTTIKKFIRSFPFRDIFESKSDNSIYLPIEKKTKIFAKYVFNLEYLTKLKDKSRHNFQTLSFELKKNNFSLFREIIFDDEVPQVLLVKDLNATNSVISLRKKGIPAYLWPGSELPEKVEQSNKFPITNHYNKLMVLLPVHKDIRRSDIDFICRLYSSL
jgi:dTDP-4-amino-4,6-dideoxygalactose transaminase